MKSPDYQRMKEGFESYLKSRQYTSTGILSRMRVFKFYWEWMQKRQLEPEQVGYNDLLLYMKDQQKTGITQSTIRSYVGTVRHFYEYLIREERITTNPSADIEVKGIKRKTLYYILEPHELHALYNHYPEETYRDKRNKTLLGILLYQGAQVEELGKMETGQVNLKEGKITIPGGYNSNSREHRLESCQIMHLYEYLHQTRTEILNKNPVQKHQAKKQTDRLFITEGGNYYSISKFVTQTMLKVRKINPQVLNAKQIRASVITKWLKTYNLRETQYLAGHRYVSSTEQYLQNDMDGLKEEIQQFHPLG